MRVVPEKFCRPRIFVGGSLSAPHAASKLTLLGFHEPPRLFSLPTFLEEPHLTPAALP